MDFIWHGEENRAFMLYRPCHCGCDERDGKKGVGYLTASDKKGNGFTIWLENEAVFQTMLSILKEKDVKLWNLK